MNADVHSATNAATKEKSHAEAQRSQRKRNVLY